MTLQSFGVVACGFRHCPFVAALPQQCWWLTRHTSSHPQYPGAMPGRLLTAGETRCRPIWYTVLEQRPRLWQRGSACQCWHPAWPESSCICRRHSSNCSCRPLRCRASLPALQFVNLGWSCRWWWQGSHRHWRESRLLGSGLHFHFHQAPRARSAVRLPFDAKSCRLGSYAWRWNCRHWLLTILLQRHDCYPIRIAWKHTQHQTRLPARFLVLHFLGMIQTPKLPEAGLQQRLLDQDRWYPNPQTQKIANQECHLGWLLRKCPLERDCRFLIRRVLWWGFLCHQTIHKLEDHKENLKKSTRAAASWRDCHQHHWQQICDPQTCLFPHSTEEKNPPNMETP